MTPPPSLSVFHHIVTSNKNPPLWSESAPRRPFYIILFLFFLLMKFGHSAQDGLCFTALSSERLSNNVSAGKKAALIATRLVSRDGFRRT